MDGLRVCTGRNRFAQPAVQHGGQVRVQAGRHGRQVRPVRRQLLRLWRSGLQAVRLQRGRQFGRRAALRPGDGHLRLQGSRRRPALRPQQARLLPFGRRERLRQHAVLLLRPLVRVSFGQRLRPLADRERLCAQRRKVDRAGHVALRGVGFQQTRLPQSGFASLSSWSSS